MYASPYIFLRTFVCIDLKIKILKNIWNAGDLDYEQP